LLHSIAAYGLFCVGRSKDINRTTTSCIAASILARGEVKTLTLKNEGGKWYACFSCMVDAEPLPVHDSVLGIDVGLESFAVTSDAEITRQPTLLSEGTKGIAPKATSCVSLYQTFFGLAQGL